MMNHRFSIEMPAPKSTVMRRLFYPSGKVINDYIEYEDALYHQWDVIEAQRIAFNVALEIAANAIVGDNSKAAIRNLKMLPLTHLQAVAQ